MTTREKIKHLRRNPHYIVISLLCKLPYFRFIKETANTQSSVTFFTWFMQKIMGFNRNAYWPMHFSSRIYNPQNVLAGIDTAPGIMPGCYIMAAGKIYIGDYTQIAPGVGLITANHDFYENRLHREAKAIRMGIYCWVGMNSMILPGVELGDFTIVGAGAVVTRSFSEGYCVVAGNPAQIIKKLEKERCIRHKNDKEYNGYIPHHKFEAFRKNNLNV